MDMRKWLISAVTFTLVLATAGVVTAFNLASGGSGNEYQDVEDEWVLVEASDWTGGVSLRLPPGWQLNELQGLDSYVGEIVGGGAGLGFDFGWYSSSLVEDDDPQHIVTYEEIGGLRAKLVLPRGEGEGLLTGVYFEDFDSDLDIPSQNRLQMSGLGLTPDQRETALAIFRTIRPLASESQPNGNDDGGTIEPGLGEDGPSTYEEWLSNHRSNQGPVTSIDDIDPNVCNMVHNINACTAEEMEQGFANIASDETEGTTEPGVVVGHAMCSLEAPNCNDMVDIMQDEGDQIEPSFEVPVSPEPPFVNGEPQDQSPNDAWVEDCNLAGGLAYVTFDGVFGCIVAHDLKDGGEELVPSSQPPTVIPQPEPAS